MASNQISKTKPVGSPHSIRAPLAQGNPSPVFPVFAQPSSLPPHLELRATFDKPIAPFYGALPPAGHSQMPSLRPVLLSLHRSQHNSRPSLPDAHASSFTLSDLRASFPPPGGSCSSFLALQAWSLAVAFVPSQSPLSLQACATCAVVSFPPVLLLPRPPRSKS